MTAARIPPLTILHRHRLQLTKREGLAISLVGGLPMPLTLWLALLNRMPRVSGFLSNANWFRMAILMGTTWTARAGSSSPVIVIPGRPGVPIIINGVDASYAVVEGDWGLAKGIHVQPTVYGGRLVDPEPHVGDHLRAWARCPAMDAWR